ncbi:MAG: permease prefix domain 1-containing protein [Lachnospirales bacterium]
METTMEIQLILDELFSNYENTSELNDLKEEMGINLQEMVNDFEKKGNSHEESVKMALQELGDMEEITKDFPVKKITPIDTITKAIEDIDINFSPIIINTKTKVYYLVFASLFVVGVFISAFALFAAGINSALFAFMAFSAVSVGSASYIYLINENKTHWALSKIKSISYSLFLFFTILYIGTALMLVIDEPYN